jgi:hypothetical protein
MNTSKYKPDLSRGMRVRFAGHGHHPKSGQYCSIVRVLPNPSRRREHQWYDVRFDDHSMGRFQERLLAYLKTDGDETAA